MGRVDGKVASSPAARPGSDGRRRLLLAREGAAVVVADLDEDGAEVVAKEITADGGRAVGHQVDIGEEASSRRWSTGPSTEFGGLHILFNNAADTSLNAMIQDTPVTEMSVEWWDHAMRIDLRGAMLGCKHAIPRMIDGGGGAIVNTSSNQGIVGDLTQTRVRGCEGGRDPADARASRRSTAARASGATRCRRERCARPRSSGRARPRSSTRSRSHSLIPRIGEPEDLANTVLFLVSDESVVHHRPRHPGRRRPARAPAPLRVQHRAPA